MKDGIREPLILWHLPNGDDILVDGHNRWKIAARHGGMFFETKKMTFDDRDEVKAWIIKNQFGRRNLSAYDRSVLALKLKPLIAKKAEKNLHRAEGKGCQKSDKVKAIDTKKEIAKAAGVSHDTINRVERIEAKASEPVKKAVREGRMSINQAFNSTFPRRQDPVRVAKEEHEQFKQNKDTVVSLQDAKIDQMNQKIISNAMTQEVLKLLSTIEKFGYMHKEEELKVLKDELPEESARILVGTIKNCYRVLEKIQNAIERRK